jgi:pantetheine-phosphate adenylyltransferase
MTVKVCVGGTFNVIHDGHLALLSRAFDEGDEVYVGLTSNALASRNKTVPVRDYHTRLKNLMNLFARLSKGKHFHIFQLDDELGPAIREDYDVIVVSGETLAGAERINKARKENGLKPLRIVVIDFVLGPDGEKISSTKIIKGKS